MNGQDLLRRLKAYPVASVAGFVTLILILIVYVRGMGQSELERRFEDASNRWSQMEINVFKNSVNLETHLENAEAISQGVKERLIRPSALASNYQYFYRMEASTGVRITALQQQSSAPPPPSRADRRRARRSAPEPEPLFSKVGYSMTMSGDFYQVLEFLYALERGQHFYHLKDFALQKSSETENRDITITMNFDLLGTP